MEKIFLEVNHKQKGFNDIHELCKEIGESEGKVKEKLLSGSKLEDVVREAEDARFENSPILVAGIIFESLKAACDFFDVDYKEVVSEVFVNRDMYSCQDVILSHIKE